MAGQYQITFWEYGTAAKASRTSVHIPTLTTGNIVAQTALAATFLAACQAISLGNTGAQTLIADVIDPGKVPSANTAAQRENKWLVSCVETGTGNPVTFTVPCYDSDLIAADGESMDTTTTEYTDMVAATNAFVRSNDGTAVTVTSIKFRARSM